MWQSLKSRFLRSIATNLSSYDLDPELQKRFEAGLQRGAQTGNGSKTKKKQTTMNIDDLYAQHNISPLPSLDDDQTSDFTPVEETRPTTQLDDPQRRQSRAANKRPRAATASARPSLADDDDGGSPISQTLLPPPPPPQEQRGAKNKDLASSPQQAAGAARKQGLYF